MFPYKSYTTYRNMTDYTGKLSSLGQKRITNELKYIHKNLGPNTYFKYDENDLTKFSFMLIGLKDTPYYLGFFLYNMLIPNTYPTNYPSVHFMTHYKNFRFHPNLYENGKICLSILGTWPGEERWTQAMSMMTVIVEIQSRIGYEHPIICEPGHEKDAGKPSSIEYNQAIQYMSILAAIYQLDEWLLQVKEKQEFINPFGKIMKSFFLENYNEYHKVIDTLKCVDGKRLSTLWASYSVLIDIKEAKKQITNMKEKLENLDSISTKDIATSSSDKPKNL